MSNRSIEPTQPHPAPDRVRRDNAALRTNWFERVTSFLTALILLLGTIVLLLAVVWVLCGDQMWDDVPPWRPEIVRGTVHPEGVERDFVQPGAEETAELNQPSMQDKLLAVTDVASRVAGSFSTAVTQQGEEGKDGGGNSRPPGPGFEKEVTPRFERWQLEFRAKDVDSYARQLDHYGIELGLVGGSIQGVDYAHDLTAGPKLRRGEAESEKRLYFMWHRPSRLMQFDVELLKRAGAEQVERRHILKFIPAELENQLAMRELEYALARGPMAGPSVESIVKTIFTSEPEGDGYRFSVTDQRYRKQQE